jgi:hypothetical protein
MFFYVKQQVSDLITVVKQNKTIENTNLLSPHIYKLVRCFLHETTGEQPYNSSKIKQNCTHQL